MGIQPIIGSAGETRTRVAAERPLTGPERGHTAPDPREVVPQLRVLLDEVIARSSEENEEYDHVVAARAALDS